MVVSFILSYHNTRDLLDRKLSGDGLLRMLADVAQDLQFVVVLLQELVVNEPKKMDDTYVLVSWDILPDTLSFPHLPDDLAWFGVQVERRATRKNLPVIEHRLMECLASSVGPKIGSETEGLVDGEIGFDFKQRSAWSLFFREDVGQPLSMPAIVFGCQRMGILIFLHNHLVVLRVRATHCR